MQGHHKNVLHSKFYKEYEYFFPPHKGMLIHSIGSSTLPRGVNESLNSCEK